MEPPNLRLSDVIKASESFLQKYYPSHTLPIPIEEIVELKIGIAIIVVPGIKSLLGIDSFINSDFTQITVDENSFVKFPERTRFSITHEIGHFILHKDWYQKYGPQNLGDYISFYDKMDKEVYKYIEIQAQTFAGLVLVPKELLFEELKKKLCRIPSMESPEILASAVQDLPEVFKVSDAVILRRLQKEGIVKNDH